MWIMYDLSNFEWIMHGCLKVEVFFVIKKKSYYLYQKINKFKSSWVPMNNHGYWDSCNNLIFA